jgi:hypothetical protein
MNFTQSQISEIIENLVNEENRLNRILQVSLEALNTTAISYQTITAVDPVTSDFLCAPGDDDPTLLKSFTVYPNPTSTNQTLDLVFQKELKKNPIQINLLDQYGRTVQSEILKQDTSDKKQFDIYQLFSEGMFYIQVYFDDGSIESQTILIK